VIPGRAPARAPPAAGLGARPTPPPPPDGRFGGGGGGVFLDEQNVCYL